MSCRSDEGEEVGWGERPGMNGLIMIPWRGHVSMSVDLLDSHEMAWVAI